MLQIVCQLNNDTAKYQLDHEIPAQTKTCVPLPALDRKEDRAKGRRRRLGSGKQKGSHTRKKKIKRHEDS